MDGENKMIEVQGVEVRISDDTLECYFENPRNGGGKIVNFQRNNEVGVAYITFADVEVAKRIVKKTHKIDNCDLHVKLYIPPPRPSYTDRLLITSIKDTTTKDCLINYLEVRGQCDIEDSSVVYGDQEGAAVVIFDLMPDFDQLQEACARRSLEGSKLTISKVPISNIIIVQGLASMTSKDAVWNYFEGKRSGNVNGVSVENVHMKSEEGACLVYFKNHAVIEQILDVSNGQKLEGSTLNVSIYYECLHPTTVEVCSPTPFEMPSPLEIKNLNRHKLHFIKESKAAEETLLTELEVCHAELSWSESDDSSIILTCTLTTEVEDNYILSQSWAANVECVLLKYLSLVEVEEIKVLQDVWDEVKTKLDNKHIDGASMFVSEDLSSIVITGFESVRKEKAAEVKSLVKNIQITHERKQQEISAIISNVTLIQLNLLVASDFPKQMMSKFPDLAVDVNLQTVEISFQGFQIDVMKSQVEMFKSLQSTKQCTLTNLTKGQLELIDKKGVPSYIVNKLKNKGLVGVWEVVKTEVNILAFSESDAADVAEIVGKSVTEHRQALYPEAVTLLLSEKWDKFSTELSNRYGDVKITHEAGNSCIIIIATDDVIAVILQEVDDFICNNAILTKKINFPSGVQHFLQRHCHDDINQITSDLKSLQVQVKYTSRGDEFIIHAPKHGIESAMKALKDLASKVEHKEYVHKRFGFRKIIKSQRGCVFIASLESTEQCVIKTESDRSWKRTVGNHQTLNHAADDVKSYMSNLKDESSMIAHDQTLNQKPSSSQGAVSKVSAAGVSIMATFTNILFVNGVMTKPENFEREVSIHSDGSSKIQRSNRKTRQFDKPSMVTACFGDSVIESCDIATPWGPPSDVDKSTISLFYFSNKLTHIDHCIELVEAFCGEEITEKIIKDDLLNNLNPSQIKRLKSFENDYQVKVTFQQHSGQLHIQGLLQDVSNASDVVQSILREVINFKQECKKAEILSNQVKWYFIDTDTQGQEIATEYDKDVNGTIEKAHYGGCPTITLQAGASQYVIDFKAMEEFAIHDRSDSVKVVRMDLIKVDESKIKIMEVESAHFEAVKSSLIDKLFKQYTETTRLPSGIIQIKYHDLTTDKDHQTQELISEEIKLQNVTVDDQKITSVVKAVHNSTPELFCAHIPEQQIIVMFGEDLNKLEIAKQKIQVDLEQLKKKSCANRTFSSITRTMDYKQISNIQHQLASNTSTTGVKSLVRGKLLDVMVYKGDITRLSVDAIVNAANGPLAHGAGVARAIAVAAGDELVKEGNRYIREHGQIPASGVVVTTAGRLPYKKVLHAVGPEKYKYTDFTECLDVLCETILRCLCEARKLNMTSVAIPAISSGIYGVPKQSCAQMYVRAVKSFDAVISGGSLTNVHFVDINEEMLQLIQQEFVKEWKESLNDDILKRNKKFIDQCLADADVPGDLSSSRSVISTAELSASKPSQSYAAAASRNPAQSTSSADAGIQIIVYKEDIFKVQCNGLVCWKNPGFTHGDHPIAQKIFDKAGKEYKNQLSEKKKKNSHSGSVFSTDGGNLHQHLIIHGVISKFSPSVTDFKSLILQIVSKVDQKKLQSFVIPVFRHLGSNSVKIFTETLCQAVKDFSKENPKSTLKQILVVDLDQKVVDFVNEIVTRNISTMLHKI